MKAGKFAFVLLPSTNHALRAERVLQSAGIASKLIPVPRHISSQCGVCLRISVEFIEKAMDALQSENLKIDAIIKHP